MKTHPMLALDLFHVLQNPHLRETLRSTREASVPANVFYEALHDACAEFLASRLEAPLLRFGGLDLHPERLERATYSNYWLYRKLSFWLYQLLSRMGFPGDYLGDDEPPSVPLSPGEIEMFLDFCSLYLLDYLSENYSYSSKPLDLFKVAKPKSKKSKSKKPKSKSRSSARLRITM